MTPLLALSLITGCHICGKAGNSNLKFPFGWIREDQKTCVQIAVETFKKSIDCEKSQARYKQCCDGTYISPSPPSFPPTPSPVAKVGSNKICNLCRENQFPLDPHHVINMLYIGAATCETYYYAGLKGQIPTHLCDPLRFFAENPCGCRPARTPNLNRSTSKSNSKPFPSLHKKILKLLLICISIILINMLT